MQTFRFLHLLRLGEGRALFILSKYVYFPHSPVRSFVGSQSFAVKIKRFVPDAFLIASNSMLFFDIHKKIYTWNADL